MPATLRYTPAYDGTTQPVVTLNTTNLSGTPAPSVDLESAYIVKIVDKYGAVLRTMVNANVERITEAINGYGTDIEWTFPKYDPAIAAGQGADVQLLKREAQVWQNGAGPIAWGVLVGARGDGKDGAIDVTAPGLGWYLSRRHIDKARDNYITNPGFEDGLTGWTTVNCTPTVITSQRRLGANAVRLTSSTADGSSYLATTFAVTGTEVGTNVYVAGHYFTETFNAPALELRGLFVQAGPPAGAAVQFQSAIIDSGSPINEWDRIEIPDPIAVPANTTWHIEVRLYVGNGSVVWDAVQGVIPESVSDYNVDIASGLFPLLIAHAQSAAAGKSDLNITTNAAASGVTVPVKAWQFDEHTPAESAIRELVERDDGFDWRVQFSQTDRVATTYSPRIGVDRSGSVTLELGVNVADYQLGEDGATTENNITVYGDGDGPDREEGYAVDTADLDGLVLQGVYQAPPSTAIDALEPIAGDHLSTKKRLVRHLTVTTIPSLALVQLLKIGDIVTVVINDGWVQVSGSWRIVNREHYPRSETMNLTLNEEV